MNTPAHLLLGAAAFGKRGQRRTFWAAMAGGLAPDLSLYLLAGGALFLFGIPPRVVFDELYFSDTWQAIFAVDNSVFVWGALLALALWRRSDWGLAFAAAGLLHLALDFPLHHDDGRPHFWPVSDWVFESPLSYWDRAHGAGWIAPIEAALAALAAVWIWLTRPGWAIAIAVGALLAAQLYVAWVWLFVFGM
ncbi:cobalamin biosynthesis protein CobQ [Sulfitobacter albidus]|uniref:Cobalamin biosynthesis protein CobQ n=1 Tax=Sulfitobacter albidus TaxID=2829501 RepID=A0A975PLE2_9RHOB|nr:cobalamin biosynthesis protein CobQ [Sulfitobacter albidus]QUJ75276.1 cobalamin biosynthesis protein CobQ [Sulfitobacter albidus]